MAVLFVSSFVWGVLPTHAADPIVSSGGSARETARGTMLTLGDVDPRDPAEKVARFQPLADYLAEGMRDLGVTTGRVVIAREIGHMADLMASGQVDAYFDSPFPTLAVQEGAGTEVILRRWKDQEPEYWSLIVALRDAGIRTIEDLRGKVIAVEEPYSTSGFLLPAGTLMGQGFVLRQVDALDAGVGGEEIGYYFAGDEENIVELLLRGRVAGGALSNQDFQELPEDLAKGFVVLGESVKVPRQLVSVRSDLDPAWKRRLIELLVGLDRSPRGRQILDALGNTRKFDPLPQEGEEALLEVKRFMRVVLQEKGR